MHRSGTSALAGVLGRLGLMLPAPDDLVVGRYDNPVHYESRALTDVDDGILAALGGSWSAPPVLAPGWERSDAVRRVTGRVPIAARRAFPVDGPVVWKDPRLCLLLPLWRSLLPPPVVTVLLWRSPLAVARSLGFRQGFSVSLGLALWERYNRDALAALADSAVYVMRYESLLDDPLASVTSLARWLTADGRVPVGVGEDAVSAAAASVSEGLARHQGGGEPPEELRSAVATLAELTGGHDRLPNTPARQPPLWMADAIAQRRDYEELYARYMRYVRLRRRIPLVGRTLRRPRRGGDGVGGTAAP